MIVWGGSVKLPDTLRFIRFNDGNDNLTIMFLSDAHTYIFICNHVCIYKYVYIYIYVDYVYTHVNYIYNA